MQTHDEAASQGWAPFVVDTNGNGKLDDYVGLNDPVDPKKDKHVQVGFYGASPSPADGTVWASYLGFPGGDRPLRSQDQADRVLRSPVQGPEEPAFRLQPARHGHRQQWRGVGGAGQRSYGELRPASSARVR